MEASVLIHVVDISGSTDEGGNPCSVGTRDPKDDIKFLEEEIDYWILGILKRNLHTIVRKSESTKEKFSSIIEKQLSGLGIRLHEIDHALERVSISASSTDDELLDFIKILREKSKPIIIVGNKIDVQGSDKILERVTDVLGIDIVPCSAASELALRKAAEKGIIKYNAGDSDFEIIKEVDSKQLTALNFIREHVLSKYGSTGVQKIIDKAVFDVLKMIVVYPVENEHKFTDHKGNVLPDAILMKKSSTALDLAYRVHEDIGKHFISAIDARTGRRVSADYELKNGDVISIKAGR